MHYTKVARSVGFGANASRRAAVFHVTAACSFLSILRVAVVDVYVAHPRFYSKGVGGGL